MTYSVSRKGNSYAVIDENGNFIDDETGKKADMEKKANELNSVISSGSDGVNTETVNATGTTEDNGITDKELEDLRARARFVSDTGETTGNTNQAANTPSTKQVKATDNTNGGSAAKGFVLTANGWLAK